MEAVYCILRYLKKDPRKGLMFKNTINQTLEVYTSVDWADPLVTENPFQDIVHLFGGI